jgi:hypothetical protein
MSSKARIAAKRAVPQSDGTRTSSSPSDPSDEISSSTHLIGAHFNEDVYRAFRRLAADQLKTHDAILTEALVLYFAQRGPGVPSGLRAKAQRLGLTID